MGSRGHGFRGHGFRGSGGAGKDSGKESIKARVF
jgi:hypothetical protein